MINKKLLSFDPRRHAVCVAVRTLPMAQPAVQCGFVWALAGIVGGALGAGLATGAWPAAFASA